MSKETIGLVNKIARGEKSTYTPIYIRIGLALNKFYLQHGGHFSPLVLDDGQFVLAHCSGEISPERSRASRSLA